MRLLLAASAAAVLAAASPASAQDWLSYDGLSLDAASRNGLVVVGVDYGQGFDGSMFVWRPYDPATGKLLDTKWAGTGAALAGLDVKSTLFAFKKVATNPLVAVRGDQRVKADARGIGYRMAELPPGHYVLEGYNYKTPNSVFHTTFEGPVPSVHVEAGKISYAGDIAYAPGGGRRAPATARLVGEDPAAANAFLRGFPKITGEVQAAPVRMVALQCSPYKPPLIPFVSCKQESSLVSEIAAAPSESAAASVAPAGGSN